MLTYNINLPLVAISYDTVTFNDLQFYLKYNYNLILHRQDPAEFFNNATKSAQYINLVIQDLSLRKKISNHLDSSQFDRFTFVHPDASVQGADIATGVMIYPGTVIYPGTKIQNDIIIHGLTVIGHNIQIGVGTYISASVTIGGSTTIGNYCFIGMSCNILDNVKLIDNTTISSGSTIRHSIELSGTWATVGRSKLVKLK